MGPNGKRLGDFARARLRDFRPFFRKNTPRGENLGKKHPPEVKISEKKHPREVKISEKTPPEVKIELNFTSPGVMVKISRARLRDFRPFFKIFGIFLRFWGIEIFPWVQKLTAKIFFSA